MGVATVGFAAVPPLRVVSLSNGSVSARLPPLNSSPALLSFDFVAQSSFPRQRVSDGVAEEQTQPARVARPLPHKWRMVIAYDGTKFAGPVALLLQIGREALPPDVVPKIMAARDRKELAKVALSSPPQGLSLMSVNYNSGSLEPPEGCPAASFGRTHSVSKCKLAFY
ncbi:hypothetical protein BHE74_00047623 [Ensete ventricosum]|uniref:Uncharacterized protein n=1 Tax=Ensete ventricosum TaxID=4639 RepID=A0A427B8W3_ENSVE|nr:hypothetical protein B296_00012677 [Ensete ventricosum]RWV82698.1 hypothetical protein GW17_00055781 [Ensete ventricosum]RWW46450.1 hypothetical protein BHE74_00047623 [Ensete ventricosum]RZR82499.1 hypothetical protein BHM03_00008941 [Ensete ventricosum]